MGCVYLDLGLGLHIFFWPFSFCDVFVSWVSAFGLCCGDSCEITFPKNRRKREISKSLQCFFFFGLKSAMFMGVDSLVSTASIMK